MRPVVDLPPIDYRPTFGLDASGLVVGKVSQEDYDFALQVFRARNGIDPPQPDGRPVYNPA